jgi:glycolate oxidase
VERSEISDHSGLRGKPALFFEPESIQALSSFLVANPSKKIRVGAGLTGVHGGAVPDSEEVYISMCRLNRINWFDEGTGILMAEGGVTMEKIKSVAENAGWFFPVIPGSLNKATIGGMISCNGGGPFSLKYGKVGNYVLRLEILLADGSIIETGGYANKISEGIDSRGIWIGAEGTLGIIVRACIRCLPPTGNLVFTRIAHPDFQLLLNLIPALLKKNPSLLEIAEQKALMFSSCVKESVLWIATPENLQTDNNPGFKITVHDETIIEERFLIGKNLQSYKPFIDLDVSFPVGKAAEAIPELIQLLTRSNLEHIVFGHGGDANFHIHVFFNEDQHIWNSLTETFDKVVLNYDGVISGEHGIGKIHHERFLKRLSPGQRRLYVAIKKELDPENRFPSLI